MRPVFIPTITGATTTISTSMGGLTITSEFRGNSASIAISHPSNYESISEPVDLDALRMIVSMLTGVVNYLEDSQS
jgi:hypothetical protein